MGRGKGRHFVSRHWRGELPVPTALLVSAVIVAGSAMAGIRLLALAIQSAGLPLRASAALELGVFALSVLVWLWAVTGIVRLSLRRWGGGDRGSAAFAFVGAVLLSAGLSLYHREEIAHLPHLAALAGGTDPFGPPAEVRLEPDGGTVSLDGTLALGSARAFAKILERAPRAKRVVLRSDGGRLHEAEDIARLVRRRGLHTHVEEHCHSACTDILLAGRRRTAAYDAKLGFHQATSPGISSGESWLRAREARQRLRDSGVAPEFARKAAATPSERMWFPAADELLAAGFLTEVDLSAPLRRLAEEENRSAPRMLDRFTRLDGASVDGNVLSYAHTVLWQGAGFRADLALEQRLAEETCIDEGLAALVGAGAAVRYLYRGRSGAELGRVTIEACEAD